MAGQDFHATSEAFLSWFKSLPGATFSDSIQIVDFRDRNAGRGIGTLSRVHRDLEECNRAWIDVNKRSGNQKY
jgi:N-lysine methyltransferase SETD6